MWKRMASNSETSASILYAPNAERAYSTLGPIFTSYNNAGYSIVGSISIPYSNARTTKWSFE